MSGLSIAERIAALTPDARAAFVRSLPETYARAHMAHFPEWAHRGQTPPEGDWRTWVIMGGRGFGKTRAGAEWVLGMVRGAGERSYPHVDRRPHPSAAARLPPASGRSCPLHDLNSAGRCSPDAPGGRGIRIALVGASIDDARSVMVEGPSGLLALARAGEVQRWSAAERRLVFANGAEAALFSGCSPQKLRGPEHDFAWCDELGKWTSAGATWDMLQMGLRRGDAPRCVVTTTPAAEPALLRVLAAAGTVRSGGATHANPHLPGAFVAAVEAAYGGTRLGAQEIEGVLAVDREGSLWPLGLIEGCRWGADGISHSRGPAFGGPSTIGQEADGPPPRAGEEFRRVVVGVDPPASAAGTCGIVVAGLGRDGRAWVLADASVEGGSPEVWARAVARAVADWGADRVVAEVNHGGDMVASVLRAAAVAMPLKLVRAARGKAARAEPVAALFESGRAGFAGRFAALEAELTQFTAGGWRGEGSPDRADAMVWALWALCLEGQGEPGVRIA